MDINSGKCAKCDQDLRIAPEQIGIDNNGQPIYKTYGYCDSCMMKYENPYMYAVTEPKRTHSKLSIIAFILTMISCTSFVGFVLAIIDLNKNDKTKKHILSWVSIVIFAIFFFLLIIYWGVMKGTSTMPQTNSTKEPAPITQTVKIDDGIINIESNGCTLKYLRHEMVENAFGDECLAVFYEFTNNSEETTSCIYTFSDKAFQNGIELETSYVYIEDVEDNGSKEIRPGISVEVYTLFEPQDNSVVELEVSEWISLSDTPLDTMQLALE